jgi:hypothetical protein
VHCNCAHWIVAFISSHSHHQILRGLLNSDPFLNLSLHLPLAQHDVFYRFRCLSTLASQRSFAHSFSISAIIILRVTLLRSGRCSLICCPIPDWLMACLICLTRDGKQVVFSYQNVLCVLYQATRAASHYYRDTPDSTLNMYM